jgi:hypothetical protein
VKDRQDNGQKKKEKKTNNDLQNTTQKTKNRVTRTPIKTGVNSVKIGNNCYRVGNVCHAVDYQRQFPAYLLIGGDRNTMGATHGRGSAYPSGATDVIPSFSDVRVARS